MEIAPPSLTFGIYIVTGLLLRIKKKFEIKSQCDFESIRLLIKCYKSRFREHFVQPFIGAKGVNILKKLMMIHNVSFKILEHCLRLIVALQRSSAQANHYLATSGFMELVEDMCTHKHSARIRNLVIYILTNIVFNCVDSVSITTPDASIRQHIKVATRKVFHTVSRLLCIEHVDTKLTAVRLASALLFPHKHCLNELQQHGWILFSNEMATNSILDDNDDEDDNDNKATLDFQNDNITGWVDIVHSAMLRLLLPLKTHAKLKLLEQEEGYQEKIIIVKREVSNHHILLYFLIIVFKS